MRNGAPQSGRTKDKHVDVKIKNVKKLTVRYLNEALCLTCNFNCVSTHGRKCRAKGSGNELKIQDI